MSVFLKSIKIKNFRTFGDFDLNVAPVAGLVIVSGPNGLGKSSFFDAIEWGLTSDVRRFEKFLRRGDTEADYLTRETTPAFGHKVILGFNDGQDVTREGAEAKAVGTSDAELKSYLIDPDWDHEVDSLQTYLGLTHFLGQGSQQRFMSLGTGDQWETLRAPAGVNKLEQIRNRLRGPAATQAFNRKAEASRAAVSAKEEELARWDALIERLRRLEHLAQASAIEPRQQLAMRAAELYIRVPSASKSEAESLPADVETILISVLEGLKTAQKEADEEAALLARVARIPDQYTSTISQLDAATVSAGSLSQARELSEAAVAKSTRQAENLDLHRQELSRQVNRLQERLNLLQAAQQDLSESGQATNRREALEKSAFEHEQSLARLELEYKLAQATLSSLETAKNVVEAAKRRHAVATNALLDASRLLELENALVAAEARLVEAGVELDRCKRVDALAAVNFATSELQSRRQRFEDLSSRAGLLKSALSAISNHLSHSATECPLCKSHFPVGELKRLAELSAADVDSELPKASTLVTEAEQAVRVAQSQIQALEKATADFAKAQTRRDECHFQLTGMRSRLLTDNGILEPDADILSIAQARLTLCESQLNQARHVLTEQEKLSEEVISSHSLIQENLKRVQDELFRLQIAASEAKAEEAATRLRFSLRMGVQAPGAEEITTQIKELNTLLIDEVRKLDHAVTAHVAERQVTAAFRLEETQLAAKLSEQQTVMRDLRSQISELEKEWVYRSMPMPVSSSVLNKKLAALHERMHEIRSTEEARVRLTSALENTAISEDLDNVRLLVATTAENMTVEAYRSSLVEAIQSAKAYLNKIVEVRQAITALGERLKTEADAFTNGFLLPLNKLIGAFNDALLTTPGTSVFFKTDYMANRTQFSARLRRRKKIGDISEIRPIDPHLILSEGQLAANGFSILCSASVSYQWSRWSALLLDDPIQHNDVIHAAAFTDVMRNLVTLKNYQVFMSSHDRGETEFIERKFTAAGLPCTVVQLIGDTQQGVAYEIRHNDAAEVAMGSKQLLKVG